MSTCAALASGHYTAPTMAGIALNVAAKHGVQIGDLKGRSISQKHVQARQEAMWRMRQVKRPSGEHRWSTTLIGHFFDRDHTTIIHGERAHAKRAALLR